MFKFKYWLFLFTLYSLYALTTLHALTTLNVTLSSDNNPGGIGEVGDLRYCLNTMNQSLNTMPDDYAIAFAFPMTIQLNGILPIINNSSNPVNITIGNPGSIPTVTIDGNSGAYSGFFIPMGNVTIQNIIFQNMTAKGGNGGDGISGGGGGMGAGGAIYVPQSFLNGSNPSITLINVSINNCSAVGGNGGSYLGLSSTGNEGGGGGGGFSGNGGSITTIGSTGGAGGGGFGGDGGNVTLSTDDLLGGGGGGGGGLGSRATIGTLTNLGNGGSDQDFGQDGNGYGLAITAGSGGGGNSGASFAGGGGGGSSITLSGGGGGGSSGSDGSQAQGSIPPGGSAAPSGGNGGDGGGGGGGGVVITNFTNSVDGQAGSGGYGGGGGAGAGTGAYDTDYTVQGGSGGLGGGGGGGGVDQSGTTPAGGGNSLGGGGGAGGGPSNSGSNTSGGTDIGSLGGGSGGFGANTVGSGFGGGGGGGGSGLGGAIFVDSNLNVTLQAFSGIPTTFNTSNNTTQAGNHGIGSTGGSDGSDGSALGDSIFLRSGSSLTFMANDAEDLLTLGEQVAFTDDTSFGLGGTSVFVRGNGTVVYNGTTDYQGNISINNANFKVNGLINGASINVCRNISFSSQRGTLSGIGTLTGNVFVNSGTISPDAGETLTLGSLTLNSANPETNTLGSLVHIGIDSSSTSLVSVTGPASLAGTLEIDLDQNATPGTYTVLTASAITGSFDSIRFTGTTPNYSLSYLPNENPTFVQFDFLGYQPEISIEDLAKVQLVVGTVLRCDRVRGSKKFYRLQVYMGPLGKRQILVPIAQYFEPSDLLGNKYIFVANLKARKIMGFDSHGRMLIAVNNNNRAQLIVPDGNQVNGSRVRGFAPAKPSVPEIDSADLDKVQLVVGTILRCKAVKGSNRFYKLRVDIGSLGNRQIMARVAHYLKPKDLIGKQGIFVANMEPRTIKGVESHGLLLIATNKHKQVHPVIVEGKIHNGSTVKG